MKRFVVTGANGFIGGRLVQRLEQQGCDVICAGRHPSERGSTVHFDLADRSSLANIAAAEPDGIFHLAWSTTPATAEATPHADLSINVAGSVALFALALELKVPLLFASSGGTVYGNAAKIPTPENASLNPIGAYGLGKATAELYAAHYAKLGGDVRIARISNPYGHGQSTARLQGVIPIFARRILKGEPLTLWGDGTAMRDYVAIDDAVDALARLMEASRDRCRPEAVFNIGAGIGLSLSELIGIIEKALGRKADVRFGPSRGFDIQHSILDISRAESQLGWRPLKSPAEGIESFVRSVA